MSLFTRARRHVDMNRVKELREEKIKEETIAEVQRQQENILAELKRIEVKEDPKYSNWRRELTEQMTTSDMGMVNLAATGDLDIIDTNTTYDNLNSGLSQMDNYSRSGTTVTLQGTENQIVNGTHTYYNVARYVVDGTRVSHVKITISKGGGTSSWTDRNGASNFDDGVSLNISDHNDFFAPSYYDGDLSSGTHVIPVPGNYKNLRISFEQFGKVGETGALTISNVSLQRRDPISLLVSLDDPEANSFIRGGLGGSEERKKQLKDMLEAGNEWMAYNGLEPSKTTPGDIALDTIPYEPPSPGPGGYKPPGSYDPNQFYNLDNTTPMPSPNLPQTGPGQSSIPDGTEIAAIYQSPDGTYHSVPGSVNLNKDTTKWPSINDKPKPVKWPTPGIFPGQLPRV